MILLVDDNFEQLQLRWIILERLGFETATASSAAEALAQCDRCTAVVMDLRMPALEEGLRLIRELHTRRAGVPIIVLAGLPEELRSRPERAMVREVLRKGTGVTALVEALGRVTTERLPTP